MADFKRAFQTLKKLEFSSPTNALHYNEGEEGYTFMGVYQKAHPHSRIWATLETYKKAESDIKILSKLMYGNIQAVQEVEKIYKNQYWDVMQGDLIDSQNTAEEIFIFGVNVGMKVAIKKAQEITGVVCDGVIGKDTIAALNAYDEDMFSIIYDASEKEHYAKIAESKPHLAKYAKGWSNRAVAV